MRSVQILIFITIFSLAIIGQTNRGGISGTVTDSNGAIVPGAKVTVTNVGTNQSSTVTASSNGAYSISSLEPVEYNVLVEAAKFKKSVIEKIKVDTATVQTVNVVLEVGNFTETVNVEPDTALINTESGARRRLSPNCSFASFRLITAACSILP